MRLTTDQGLFISSESIRQVRILLFPHLRTLTFSPLCKRVSLFPLQTGEGKTSL